jgi:hypothetical protein
MREEREERERRERVEGGERRKTDDRRENRVE